MRARRMVSFVVSVTLGFIVAASLAMAQSGTSIFQGTLLEPNQKTLEVSTEGNVPMPYNDKLALATIPSRDDILAAIRSVLQTLQAPPQAAQKCPDARRRPTAAREA